MMWRMSVRRDDTALKRLATLIERRRLDLRLDKIDVARAADITITTYSKVESGSSVRPVTYAKIEPVLGCADGACQDVLDGAASLTLVGPATAGIVASPVLAEDLEEDIEQAVQDAAIFVAGDLTAADIRALKTRVTDLLRERGKLPPLH